MLCGRDHGQARTHLAISAALISACSFAAMRHAHVDEECSIIAAMAPARSRRRPHLRRRRSPRSATGDRRGPSGASINGPADQRFNQMITNRVLGTVCLGVNEQVNCHDCVSAFGSAGSFSVGIHGRKELTNNLSLLAGLAYTQHSEGGYHVTSAPIGAFAPARLHRPGSSRQFFRYRHHPTREEGALQPQLHDKPGRGVARQFDQQPNYAVMAAPAGSTLPQRTGRRIHRVRQLRAASPAIRIRRLR